MKKPFFAIAALASVAILSCCIVRAQSELPPPFPRQNATKLLETDKIVVWDIAWPKGQPTAMHRHPHDQVGTYYARGGRIITQPDGSKREGMTEAGSLSTTRKGTTHIEEGATDPPLRAVFIELLRDMGPAMPVADTSGLSEKAGKPIYDDDRVTVWDVRWTSGPGGVKYHASRDTVIVFLDAGRVRTGDGVDVEVRAGTMRYVSRNAADSLEVIQGAPERCSFKSSNHQLDSTRTSTGASERQSARQLLQKRLVVVQAPILDNDSILDAVEYERREFHLAAGRRDTQKFASMCSTVSQPERNPLSVGEELLNRGGEIGESGAPGRNSAFRLLRELAPGFVNDGEKPLVERLMNESLDNVLLVPCFGIVAALCRIDRARLRHRPPPRPLG